MPPRTMTRGWWREFDDSQRRSVAGQLLTEGYLQSSCWQLHLRSMSRTHATP
jgi:hypothetical protein